jgi:antitoxin ChpS
MKTTIRKIGNSAGTILPSAILKKLKLTEGDTVEVSEDGKRIVIEPSKSRPQYRLKDLLAQCDEEAMIPEDSKDWENAPPVGGELI